MQVLTTPQRGFIVTDKFLKQRIGSGMYGVSRWIQFCQFMMKKGYTVSLYEAQQTVSKYVTVHGINDDFFTVRFSDHKPNRRRELNKDCDFFCGITHTGVRTVHDAIRACQQHFSAVKEKTDAEVLADLEYALRTLD